MSLSTLSTPLRVDWDGDWADAERARRVVRALVDAEVLFVTVDGGWLDAGDAARFGLGDLFTGARVTVRLDPARMDATRAAALAASAPALALLDGDRGATPDVLRRAVRVLAGAGLRVGLAMVPSRANVRSLVEMIDFALAAGVAEIHLPNPNVVDATDRAIHLEPITRGEYADLARAVAPRAERWRESVELHIHDLFLSRLFGTPADEGVAAAEFGGCQAAGARAFVDGTGDVYACTSMPIRLGNLLEESFADIYARPGRARLRARIESIGAGCESCLQAPGCRGGCRGLAMLREGSFEAPDILCESIGARVTA